MISWVSDMIVEGSDSTTFMLSPNQQSLFVQDRYCNNIPQAGYWFRAEGLESSGSERSRGWERGSVALGWVRAMPWLGCHLGLGPCQDGACPAAVGHRAVWGPS